ncbi:MAG: helix-turn-helix domain-containing protein [Bacteroidaceae bacterium]|nr:helix-turn-helix domain-containing protein [Bacteroidaceae bacterium]
MINIRNLFLSLSLLLVSLAGVAREYMFRHIEADEGLSNSQINAIFQDSRGYMWFGTSSGLNRYDGCQMKVYRNDMNDTRSLPDSYVRSIREDAAGLLWIETSVGFAIYHPETDDFDRDIRQHIFQYGLAEEPTSVFVDKKGDFWFYVAGKGCYWYNVAQKLLFPFEQGEGAGMLPVGTISCITECEEGTLLVYNSGLLVCVNGDLRRIAWQNDYLPNKLGMRKHEYSAFVDRNENVWVYSIPGVRIYNKRQNKWIHSMSALTAQWGLPDDPEIDNGVMGMGQDKDGVLWLATRHHGLLIVDPQAKSVKWERASETDARSLKHNSMRTLYVSPEKDVVWAGAAKSGLAYYSGSMFKFHTDVRVDVTAIAPNGKGSYWLGTSKHGILSYNPQTREIASLRTTGVDLSKHEIFSLYAGREGALWAATNRGLIFRVQSAGKVVTNYQILTADANPAPATNVITDLLEDERGYLWIATLGAGLQRLDVRTGKIRVYTTARTGLPTDRINSLELTRDRNLLMGTTGGVAVLDFEKNTITSYSGTQEGNTPYTSPYVNHVVEDHRGLWWIATRDGVNIYDTKTDRLSVIGANEGLSNAVVLGVGCSGTESVWASTAGGICNIVVEKNDTGTDYIYRIYTYSENDGLQGYEFNQRSIWVTPEGEVAMGGTHGMNVFHPNEIVYNKKLPKVIFSSLRVLDHEVKVREEVNGTVVMPKALTHDGQVYLTHAHPSFTVMFGSDDFSMPGKTRFQYKLEGFDEDWHDCVPLRNGVTFTNLSPGKYVLKVKAVNGDGYSSNETSHLQIVVTGPFWTTTWAVLIYVAVLALLLWMFLRTWKRNERLRIKKELLADESLLALGGEPLATGDEDAEVEAPSLVEAAPTEVKLPVVVAADENAEYLAYINDCLSNVFKVMPSTDAEAAWEKITEQRPDVVVLSASSIESETYFLCHRLKADPDTADIPVVLLITRQMKDELEAIGMDDVCLVKPVTREHLQKRLQLLLAGDDEQAVEALTAAMEQTPLTVEEQLIVDATRYVEENISRPDLTVEEMARQMCMSRAHLYKNLMAACGKTPVEFIRSIRLKRAAEMLKDSRYHISEVAYQVGFNTPRYFSKYFFEVYGMSPSAYQEAHK